MSEYISRDYAIKEMHAIVKRYQSPVEKALALCAMIIGAPAADVAPIIVCKDCMHYDDHDHSGLIDE